MPKKTYQITITNEERKRMIREFHWDIIHKGAMLDSEHKDGMRIESIEKDLDICENMLKKLLLPNEKKLMITRSQWKDAWKKEEDKQIKKWNKEHKNE